ncbi:MAG: hypothetical protein K6B65_00440 [Bacilli bacterium]|nr:hypothetical protein [Bacilli bacterium]
MKTNIPLPNSFLSLSKRFLDNGFSLYLIGGSSRDLLLGRFCRDFDLVTDATPEQEKAFLPDADYTFSRFGTIKVNHEGDKFDIATFRKEENYADFRHPKKIEFIKEIEVDSARRDFTINAIYIDSVKQIYDFHHGYEDLENKLIRFIGDPDIRIREDPLRILRAERFARTLGFEIEKSSKEAIERNYALLDKLNPEKVKMEKKKG